MAVHFTLFHAEEIVEIGDIGELLAKNITRTARIQLDRRHTEYLQY